LIQNVLPQMPYMMIIQFIFLKRKLQYKSIYMSNYVCPNVVIKTLQQIYKIPLYIDAKVLIKPNWQGLTEFTNVANEMNYNNMNLKKTLILII